MSQKSIPKSIIGVLLILIVIATYLGLLALMGAKAGGGIIIIIPVFMTVRYLWNKMVMQKVKIDTPNTDVKLEDNPKKDVVETPLYASNIAPTKTVSLNSNSSRGYFKRVVEFFTFQSPTYRSVFEEGHRRIVMVVSLIAPFIMAYMWFYDFEDGYVDSEWYISFPLFYFIFHLIILVYIWIREGQGTVRPGGNALRTVWNFCKAILVLSSFVLIIAFSYEEVYRPYVKTQNMIKTFEEFYRKIATKDWEEFGRLLDENSFQGQRGEYISEIIEHFKDKVLTDWSIVKLRKIDNNSIYGEFVYTLIKGNKKEKKKRIAIFRFNHFDAAYPYDCRITDIEYKDLNSN